jgi:hypothetical protein
MDFGLTPLVPNAFIDFIINGKSNAFCVPDEPTDENVARLLHRLNRCPECGGYGYVCYGGFDAPEQASCPLCFQEWTLFWDDDIRYQTVILAQEDQRATRQHYKLVGARTGRMSSSKFK